MHPVSPLHGLLAEFETQNDLLRAAEKISKAGYSRWDAFSPYPIDGLDQAMGLRNSKIGWFTFVGGALGYLTGNLMVWWMNAKDYPVHVGGKPFYSPVFAFPPSFELMVLFAAFGTLIGMLYFTRLPRLHHPLLKLAGFKQNAEDKFFIVVESTDPQYSETETRRLLMSVGCKTVTEVED